MACLCPCIILSCLHFRFSPRSFLSTAPVPADLFTLSLHDALPILLPPSQPHLGENGVDEILDGMALAGGDDVIAGRDRKSTRLNSSHLVSSYAVFCLKKKYSVIFST